MSIVNCAECNREINLEIDAQTLCFTCKKDFCFELSSLCFQNYHKKNVCEDPKASSICSPSWTINLRNSKEINADKD